MEAIPLPIMQGDGPYVVGAPFMPNGTPTTTAEWLAGEGAGATLQSQVRKDFGKALIADIKPDSLFFEDVDGVMQACVAFQPSVTDLIKDEYVSDLQVSIPGHPEPEVHTLFQVVFRVLPQVTRPGVG